MKSTIKPSPRTKMQVDCDTQSGGLNNAGVLYKDEATTRERQKYYQRAVACNPNFAQPLNNLGVLHTMSGQAQRALESLQR